MPCALCVGVAIPRSRVSAPSTRARATTWFRTEAGAQTCGVTYYTLTVRRENLVFLLGAGGILQVVIVQQQKFLREGRRKEEKKGEKQGSATRVIERPVSQAGRFSLEERAGCWSTFLWNAKLVQVQNTRTKGATGSCSIYYALRVKGMGGVSSE